MSLYETSQSDGVSFVEFVGATRVAVDDLLAALLADMARGDVVSGYFDCTDGQSPYFLGAVTPPV